MYWDIVNNSCHNDRFMSDSKNSQLYIVYSLGVDHKFYSRLMLYDGKVMVGHDGENII